MSSINFYPAARSEVNLMVELILGAPDQITTRVGLKLFDLKNLGQAKRLFGSMAKSNESWKATTLAESDGNVIGMLQSNAPSMAMSVRLAIAAVFLYGPFFMKRLMPRIQLLKKVQTTPLPGSYQISELHVAPEHRGREFGKIL